MPKMQFTAIMLLPTYHCALLQVFLKGAVEAECPSSLARRRETNILVII